MARFPDSLVIALWIVGSCWAVAIVACLVGDAADLVWPLVMFGALAGVIEWIVRRKGC